VNPVVKMVTVTLQVGTPYSEWHDACMTSGMLVFPLVYFTPSGVTPSGTFRRCITCNPPEEC